MCYVYFVLNNTYNAAIKNKPSNTTMGSSCNTYPLLRFHFWGPVFFNTEDATFAGDSPEERGCFL